MIVVMTYVEYGPHLQLQNAEQLKGYFERDPQHLADIVAMISVRETVLLDYYFHQTPLEGPNYSRFDVAQIAAMNMLQVKDSMNGDLEEWVESDGEISADYLLKVTNHYLENSEIIVPLEQPDSDTTTAHGE